MIGKAIEATFGNDHMIQKRDAEQRSSLRQAKRQVLILVAWCRNAAGMIVGDDHRCHSFADQRSKDVGQAHDDPIDLTDGGNVPTANAVSRVETEDMYGLLLGQA